MTENKSFKRRVRERMSKTGESYTTARKQVAQKRDRVRAASTRLSDTADRPTDQKIKEATGKKWDQWFSLLDRAGARKMSHSETVKLLTEKRDVPGWWAQSVTVWYQRSRGLRLKHQQADGFTISASKTVAVPAKVAYEAFVNPRRRRAWLTDGKLSLRTSQPGRTARFNWEDGSTRVLASFENKGQSKTLVAIAHEKLPDPDEAESAKLAWRQRLTDLKSYLEG